MQPAWADENLLLAQMDQARWLDWSWLAAYIVVHTWRVAGEDTSSHSHTAALQQIHVKDMAYKHLHVCLW